MYRFKIVSMIDIPRMLAVADILYQCGKDMAQKYDLHHWDNPKIKSIAVAEYCSLKNVVYLVYKDDFPVATFQVRIKDGVLHFEKLATSPVSSGKGVGTLCMKTIEKIARKNNCEKVVMEVYEPSKHALDFYIHRGYEQIGMTDTLKYKEIKMEKRLSV